MQTLRLNELVDQRRPGWFDLNVLFWTFLALFTDGYDITVVAFAAPEMARQWQIDPGRLGPVLSASMVGVFVGAPLFGFIGDRWGRRAAIIAGCALFGLTTLMLSTTHDITILAAWRFAGGIGLGGVMPNATALMAELAPVAWRAALIIVMFIGAFVGSAAPNFVMSAVPPSQSIHALFVVGGAIPLLIALGSLLCLPESVKFLSLSANPRHRQRLLRMLRRLRPDVALADDVVIVDNELPSTGWRQVIAAVFAPGRVWVTPLLWACFVCSLCTIYYLSTWLPLMLEAHGILPADAARVSALYHLGAGAGSLLISLLMDRFGFVLVTALFWLSTPVIALMGLPHRSLAFLTWMTLFAGAFGQSVQLALNAASGLLYSTAVRSKAVGWAFAVGRIGSVAGPMAGGYLFALHTPFQVLFWVAAVPMALGGVASTLLAAILLRETGSFRMRNTDHASVHLRGGMGECSEAR